MKFSTAILFLINASVVAATSPMRATANLLQNARKLEEAAQDEAEDEFAFLGNYNLKMLYCKSGEAYVNPQDGSYEYGSVVFRLCPTSGNCDDTSSTGCSKGYGDFVVGINSFVQSYLEAKKEDMQQDDSFNVDEFGECREYKADQDIDDDSIKNTQFYVGPACSSDGTTIVLDMFTDEDCKTKSTEVSFETVSNGLSLPYTTGGLVSNYCESCTATNDNGETEISEMCTNLYEFSGKCESNMESSHYSGKNVASCEFIEALLPKQKKSAGKAVGWVFFTLVILGASFAGYSFYKKRSTGEDKSFGLMSS